VNKEETTATQNQTLLKRALDHGNWCNGVVESSVTEFWTGFDWSYNNLRVRRMRTHFGDRAFSAAVPRCWNSLPPAIRFADSVDSFKAQLKTHLFAKAYPM